MMRAIPLHPRCRIAYPITKLFALYRRGQSHLFTHYLRTGTPLCAKHRVMKTWLGSILLTLSGLFVIATSASAGGNTSIVHLSEVESVKIEPHKITVIGTGYVIFWVVTDSETVKTSGKSEQLVRVKTSNGIFEIIPYFSDPEIKGVPTGGHSAENLKQLSDKGWAEMQKSYARISVGNSATIWYQQDRITLSESQVQKITGAGAVDVPKKD